MPPQSDRCMWSRAHIVTAVRRGTILSQAQLAWAVEMQPNNKDTIMNVQSSQHHPAEETRSVQLQIKRSFLLESQCLFLHVLPQCLTPKYMHISHIHINNLLIRLVEFYFTTSQMSKTTVELMPPWAMSVTNGCHNSYLSFNTSFSSLSLVLLCHLTPISFIRVKQVCIADNFLIWFFFFMSVAWSISLMNFTWKTSLSAMMQRTWA